jgi:putative aldouronate transport system substrate-binding protein
MRDVFRVAARLVRDGLLDRNAFTQTAEQLIRLGMNEKGSLVGVCQGVSQGNFADVDYTDPEARYREFAPLRPFAGPDGEPVIAWDDQPGAGAVGLAIPADSTDPETLVRWADFQLGLLSTLSMRLGVQDEHWTWAEDGDLGIDDKPALYKKIPQDKKTENTGWDEFGPFNLALDVRHGEAVDELTSFEPMLYRAGRLYEEFASDPESLFVSPFFDQDQAAQVGELRTNIDSAYVRGATSMCLGDLDPDSDADWESYLSSLSNAGVDQYIEVLTEADAAQA